MKEKGRGETEKGGRWKGGGELGKEWKYEEGREMETWKEEKRMIDMKN